MPVYVQHEVLGKVADVFNAQAIWQAPGLALFGRRPLLRDLLERSPREHRGHAATRCFSHITLMLPQDDIDDDRHLTRGARVRDLAQSLTALHRKDFGDLLGSDQVRYDVIGADALRDGEVEVKFGHAVYLPDPSEKVLYAVSTSRDSVIWKSACQIYPNQRLALVGPDAQLASCAIAGWPFGADGAVLLINDGPEAPIEVQVRPKGAFACHFDADNGYYELTGQCGADGDSARLLLKITRIGAVPDLPRAITAADSGNDHGADQTALPSSPRPAVAPVEGDATYAPVARQRVSLVALALPRLSRYRETGALALEVGFNAALGLARDERDAVISFGVDASDELHARTRAGRERIGVPASFTPVGAAVVRLLAVAPEMAERYCAILCLAQPPALAVTGGARFVFGRGAPMLAALRVLDSPRFLLRAGGYDAASADRIGLSREAFSFELAGGAYLIGRLSTTQALYHLDAQLDFVARIDNPDQPAILPAGHHLVAGHYVLRFDA